MNWALVLPNLAKKTSIGSQVRTGRIFSLVAFIILIERTSIRQFYNSFSIHGAATENFGEPNENYLQIRGLIIWSQ
jgi:hypothetical protein